MQRKANLRDRATLSGVDTVGQMLAARQRMVAALRHWDAAIAFTRSANMQNDLAASAAHNAKSA